MGVLIQSLCLTPCVDLGVGSKGQNSTFKEQFYVAYQIRNAEAWYQIICSQTPSLGLGQNSIFSEHGQVAYRIIFYLFDSLRPINNLSVKQGRVFLG